MEIHGHVENGNVIPTRPLGLPDGAEVTIVVPPSANIDQSEMTADQLASYLAALADIDSLENENPGDDFSGADHDQAIYGDHT